MGEGQKSASVLKTRKRRQKRKQRKCKEIKRAFAVDRNGRITRAEVPLSPTTGQCPGKHTPTLFHTPRPTFSCDACGKGPFPKGTEMYGCRTCNWDMCSACKSSSFARARVFLQKGRK